jgi:hypothetical protein
VVPRRAWAPPAATLPLLPVRLLSLASWRRRWLVRWWASLWSITLEMVGGKWWRWLSKNVHKALLWIVSGSRRSQWSAQGHVFSLTIVLVWCWFWWLWFVKLLWGFFTGSYWIIRIKEWCMHHFDADARAPRFRKKNTPIFQWIAYTYIIYSCEVSVKILFYFGL